MVVGTMIGSNVPNYDNYKKVTGKLKFVSDLNMPNALEMQILRSPHPHALIKKIDAGQALQVAGVKAVLTGAELGQAEVGPIVNDWPILARDRVYYAGEEVAAVCAKDKKTAAEAARLIEVDYEPLPAVLDYRLAMEAGQVQIRETSPKNIVTSFQVERGDVEKGLAASFLVKREVFETSSVYAAYLETNCCIVEYDNYKGEYTFWAATQVPYRAQRFYAQALGVSPGQVRIIQPPMGGGFGAKYEHNGHLIAALLSKKAGQAVRLWYEREEDFLAGSLRLPMQIDLTLGVDQQGIILAKKVHLIADNGARTLSGPVIMPTACFRVDSLYRMENICTEGYLVYSNTIPKGAMRGFGNAQMTFAMESLLDQIAAELNMDPMEIRKINAVEAGDITVHGWEIKSSGLRECIAQAAETADWDNKRKAKSKYHGIGLACCNHVSGYRPVLNEYDGSAARVKLIAGGYLLIENGDVEIGQGLKSTLAQIAAEVLQMPLEKIKVLDVDTEVTPYGIGTLATRGTMMAGNAVKIAAEKLLAELKEIAAELLSCEINELEAKDGKMVCSSGELDYAALAAEVITRQKGCALSAEGWFDPQTVIPDANKYGNPSPSYPFAAHIAEVEVDPDTGQVKICTYIAAHDVGKAICPSRVEGQIQGGVVQGLGWTLLEKLVEDAGTLVNNNFLDYRIPTFLDTPEKLTPLIVEPGDPVGPFGAKGVGEPAINPVVAAITNAIYDATGVRITRLPVAPEELKNLIGGKS